MKKVCIYILFILVVADHMSLSQLAKLPVLFEHYAEHQKRNGPITMMQFLSMHYWGKDIPDNDDDRDNQLPFKKVSAHIHFYFFNFPRQYQLEHTVSFAKVKYVLPEACSLPDQVTGSLFKPPRQHDTA